ncbi:MAG: MFS transporter [Gemmobacter sp.]|uniref:MFS transporter n=1 Tax=Gemmobacter sp. TaxID=1898957 RepID=UPI003918F10A
MTESTPTESDTRARDRAAGRGFGHAHGDGALAIALAMILIPRVAPEPVQRLDLSGFALSALGLGVALFGLSCIGEHLVSTHAALAAMAAGLVLIAAYLLRARGRTDALVDPRLFRHHTFAVGIISGTIFRMSGGAAAFLLPLLFRIGLGLSIVVSGLLSGLFAPGGLTMRALAPRILDRVGFRRTLILGTLVSAATFVGLGFIQSVSCPLIVPLVIVAGFAQALVFTGLNGIVFVDATEEEMGRATGLSAVTQQVGLTAGISLSALVLRLGGSPAPTAPPQLSHFPAAFWATAAVLVVAAASMAALRKGEAAALRHRPEHAHRQHERV